jgi:hypothetical protein
LTLILLPCPTEESIHHNFNCKLLVSLSLTPVPLSSCLFSSSSFQFSLSLSLFFSFLLFIISFFFSFVSGIIREKLSRSIWGIRRWHVSSKQQEMWPFYFIIFLNFTNKSTNLEIFMKWSKNNNLFFRILQLCFGITHNLTESHHH